LALWVLGYPEAALADVEHALDDAREIPHAATLMHALFFTAWTHSHCGNHSIAKAQLDELVALADEKSSLFWRTLGMLTQHCALALTGETTDAAQMITSGIKAFRSTGGTLWAPSWVSYLARAYADVGQFDDAWRCIAEATNTVQTTKEKWCEAEVHRTAGKIALQSPHPDLTKAEAYFERALAVAREQRAKSWELRAAMSMARLWRDQGKSQQARDLLGPIYGWFTEGFDTLDLRESKTLLDDLASGPRL
jgi:predicted ATPase